MKGSVANYPTPLTCSLSRQPYARRNRYGTSDGAFEPADRTESTAHQAVSASIRIRILQNGLRGRYVLGVAVVACDADGLLVPVQHAAQLVSKDLHQERLHHATSVAENVSTKRVNNFTAVRPSYRAMNGRFTDTISAVIDQRFPLDLGPLVRQPPSPSGLTGYILLPGRLPPPRMDH